MPLSEQLWCLMVLLVAVDDVTSKARAGKGEGIDLRYHAELDTKGKLQLHWDIDPPTETITFRLEARVGKDEVVGFGFSDYGEPFNADLLMMWADETGKHHFQDMHTDKYGILAADRSQDYILDDVYGKRDGRIAFVFHRQYDTCDTDDYLIDIDVEYDHSFQTGTTHVIFMAGGSGWRHGVVGANVTTFKPDLQRVQIIKSQLPDAVMPDDTTTFVMQVDHVTIPDVDTTYWCAVRKLPDMQKEHHIIRYEGAIEDHGLVHHLEVFHCEVPSGEEIENYNAPCGVMADRPKGLGACRKVIGAWAVGAEPLSYPEEVGVPVGGEGYSRYVMLEVHYNNPKLRHGVIDSSGIKFYVTKHLRKYHAGIMELGQEYTDKVALPPGLHQWNLDGYCTPECTSAGLREGGIKVFASQLHTHLTGKRAYTKHYRNGVELPELVRDNHYSPHYQEMRKLQRWVHVLPGDSLVMTCEDNTMDRSKVTLGGFTTSDEMCVNYIHYFPKVDLEVCKSSVTTESLYKFFRLLNEYRGERTSAAKVISENYKSINWTPTNIQLLRTFYETAPLSMQCNQSDGSRFPGRWENNVIPKVLFPAPPTERPCLV